MPEVFTISGAFGAPACPPGWKATAKGACGAPSGAGSPAAKALQNALRALGSAVGDRALLIAADGFIGAGTAAAVNRAFTTHIGPGQAAAEFRTGRLTPFNVAANAVTLTALINAEAARRRGAPAPAATAQRPAAVPAPAPVAARCPAGWAATKAGNCSAPAGRAIQTALKNLGNLVRDPALMKITVDGVVGPGTVAAVNRAFTLHVKPANAPSALKSAGALSLFDVTTLANAIVSAITKEIASRRGPLAPKPTAVPAPMVAACPAGWAATRSGNCSAPGGKAAPAAVALQKALRALGAVVGDRSLTTVSADGVIGPGTVAAVNRAFTTHIGSGQAPAQFRTGQLTIPAVAANASGLAQLATAEANRRGGATARSVPTTPPQSKTPGGGVRAQVPSDALPVADETIPEYVPPIPSPPVPQIQPLPPETPPTAVTAVPVTSVPQEVPGEYPPGTTAPAPFPWKWVAVGGGALAAGLVGILALRKRQAAGPRRAAPAPRPSRAHQPAMAGFGSPLGTLTKQDFQLVADVLCEHGASPAMVTAFSHRFATVNPGFQPARFERAAMSCRR